MNNSAADRTKLPPQAIRRRFEQELGIGAAADWRPLGGGLSETAAWRADGPGGSFVIRRLTSGWDLWPRDEVLRPAIERRLAFVVGPTQAIESDGHVWEATPWIEGAPLSDLVESEPAIEAAASALAEFHAAGRPLRRVGRSVVADRRSRLEDLQPLATPGDLPPPVAEPARAIAARLARAAASCAASLGGLTDVGDQAQGIHGDARPEHFLVREGMIVGLIDWGAARFDSPLIDVTRLAGELARGDAGRLGSTVDRYNAAAGVSVPHRVVRALDGANAVLSGANWLRWLADKPLPPERHGLVADRLRSILARLPGG